MFCSFEDAFMPSEEKKKLWEQTAINAQTEAIVKKQCWMCANSYLVNNTLNQQRTRDERQEEDNGSV